MPWHKPFLFLYLICSPLPFPAEKAMAPHSSTLTWKISWTEEPGRLQSIGSLRVGHDWATSLSLFTFMHWRRKWQPTPVFSPGEPQGQGSLVAAVSGVTQSRTWLKRLSSSSPSPEWLSKCPRGCNMYLGWSAAFPALTSQFWKQTLLNDITGKAQLEGVHTDTQCCLISRDENLAPA